MLISVIIECITKSLNILVCHRIKIAKTRNVSLDFVIKGMNFQKTLEVKTPNCETILNK